MLRCKYVMITHCLHFQNDPAVDLARYEDGSEPAILIVREAKDTLYGRDWRSPVEIGALLPSPRRVAILPKATAE